MREASFELRSWQEFARSYMRFAPAPESPASSVVPLCMLEDNLGRSGDCSMSVVDRSLRRLPLNPNTGTTGQRQEPDE